jgi:ubiquinone/menaquinone biosynthesis C-methylase UbiE
MKKLLVRLGLHLLARVDAAWFWIRERRQRGQVTALAAGAGIQSDRPVTCQPLGAVAWPDFPGNLAHSLWRAQEVTLFREHRHLFCEPVLDLGCGDLQFACCAGFPEKGIGVDYDFPSLQAGRWAASPLWRTWADARHLPLADGSVPLCVSNSVLEHLPDLDQCLAEVSRVLRPSGLFIFTATLGTFTTQLAYWAGTGDARQWTERFNHVQQPTEAELLNRLNQAGLTVESHIAYQNLWTTAWYRFLVSPACQFIERRCSQKLRTGLQTRLAKRVVESLKTTTSGQGACVFVVARKKAA